ncbi:17.4 kDa class III heat shock protein [Magnolia sinica]|uniref:17.4 kDa class III heat shock protein n=1 Tax=Magnolia sinica TaxID=86752 RepID=UPI00265B31D4|nr:17.4 kDa class III heat shock protein [Magnolia sinica]
MSPVADAALFNGNLATAVNHLLHHFPESIEKMVFPSHSHESNESKGMDSVPADILETAKEYVFYLDVPGLSKTDIQVTVEDENTLIIRGGGKRKREDGEDEGCKYIRLERKASPKFQKKFRLPESCNTNAVSAKCENGVLTVTVEKLPPPPKTKSVEITIS